MADTTGTADTVVAPALTVAPAPVDFDVPLTPTTASVLVALAGHPVDGRAETAFTVPLLFHEWLAYHHHIVTHQQLDRRMQVHVS
jgi:hypothetical protein